MAKVRESFAFISCTVEKYPLEGRTLVHRLTFETTAVVLYTALQDGSFSL